MDGAKDLWLQKSIQGNEGIFLRADVQTAGRGRLGRNWVSKDPNFYGTFVIHTSLKPPEIIFLSYATACALLKTLQDFGVQGAGLKWPNDILVNDHKIAGILLEMIDESVIAIGVGVNFYPTEVPGALYSVISLSQVLDQPPQIEEFSKRFLENLDQMIDLCEEESCQRIMDLWMAGCVHLQKMIKVNDSKVNEGLCLGLDAQGALCLQDPQSLEIFKIYAGDIAFLN